MIQKHIYFSGNVQGVGFRWTTRRTASDYKVTGWVKNLPDGRVELVAEGEKSEVDAFLDDLRDRMSTNIRDESVDTSDATGQYTGFEIRH